MTKTQVLKFYGNEPAVAEVLGITRQAVNKWPTPIPLKCAIRLNKDSKGKLKLNLTHYL